MAPTSHIQLVRAAREEFLTSGRIPDRLRAAVRPEIVSSWQRSRTTGAAREDEHLPFVPEFDAQSDVLTAAEGVLERLAEQLNGLGGALFLANGHAQLVRGWIPDERVQRPLRRILADPGASCSEALVGTNGIGTAVADGRTKVIGGAEHWADLHLDMTCVAAPIVHPVSRRVAGVVNLTMMEQPVHPALIALVHWGVEEIRGRLLDQVGRAERALFEQFLAQRRGGRPSLLVSRRLFVADPAVADLFSDLDAADLWERVHAGGGAGGIELELADGTVLPVDATAVGDGVGGQGVLVELRSEGRTVRRRSGRRPGPSPAFAAAVDAVAAAMRLRLPLLLVGEQGTGKVALAQRSARAAGPDRTIVVLDGHVAAEAPERWCTRVRSAVARTDVLVLRHLDLLGPRAAALLLPVLDEILCDPAAPQVVATAVEPARHDDPGVGAPVLALFGRFAGATVAVPALRDRLSDLPSLVAELTGRIDRRARWSTEALEVLARRRWPGNVRELEAVVRRTLSSSSGLIRVADLPLEIRQQAGRLRLTRMERVERDAIMAVLEASGGNKVIAAEELGISRSSLYRKIERYGLADAGQVEIRPRG